LPSNVTINTGPDAGAIYDGVRCVPDHTCGRNAVFSGLVRRVMLAGIAGALVLASALPAAAETVPLPPSVGSTITISGVGASFPAPIYTEWFAQFQATYPDAKVKFDYAATGSGSGIKAIQGTPTADYGATDAAMTEADLAKVTANGGVMHIPTVLGAVVVAYNVPGLKTTLKMTGANLADVYAGKIKKWNDPALAKTNPGVKLPNLAITVVRRSDSSGTTFVFTSYLYAVSSTWKTLLGASGPTKSFSGWPVGIGAPRNSGVSTRVATTKGAIGYMEFSYAVTAGLPMVRLKNPAGNFVTPSSATTTSAAATFQMPSDMRGAPIINATGYNSYPIVAFTYLLVFKVAPDENKGKMLVSYLYWSLTDGQAFTRGLGYAPLPSSVQSKAIAMLHTITRAGSTAPLWP
jgi:phosphate transport system substrate-binding protein